MDWFTIEYPHDGGCCVCTQSLGIWCCNVLNVTSYPNSFLHVLEGRSLGTEAMLSAIQVDGTAQTLGNS